MIFIDYSWECALQQIKEWLRLVFIYHLASLAEAHHSFIWGQTVGKVTPVLIKLAELDEILEIGREHRGDIIW